MSFGDDDATQIIVPPPKVKVEHDSTQIIANPFGKPQANAGIKKEFDFNDPT